MKKGHFFVPNKIKETKYQERYLWFHPASSKVPFKRHFLSCWILDPLFCGTFPNLSTAFLHRRNRRRFGGFERGVPWSLANGCRSYFCCSKRLVMLKWSASSLSLGSLVFFKVLWLGWKTLQIHMIWGGWKVYKCTLVSEWGQIRGNYHFSDLT